MAVGSSVFEMKYAAPTAIAAISDRHAITAINRFFFITWDLVFGILVDICLTLGEGLGGAKEDFFVLYVTAWVPRAKRKLLHIS